MIRPPTTPRNSRGLRMTNKILDSGRRGCTQESPRHSGLPVLPEHRATIAADQSNLRGAGACTGSRVAHLRSTSAAAGMAPRAPDRRSTGVSGIASSVLAEPARRPAASIPPETSGRPPPYTRSTWNLRMAPKPGTSNWSRGVTSVPTAGCADANKGFRFTTVQGAQNARK